MESQRPSNRQEFEVAIICALALEFDAVSLLFDQFWDEDGDPYGRVSGDPNHYTTGRFGKYNVVLALLSQTDQITAASAAASLRTSYSSLRLALFVGICSGVPQAPNEADEILLGDVIISSAVVQYDLSKRNLDKFIHKDTVENGLTKPNKDIRNLLVTLNTELNSERLQTKTIYFLKQIQIKQLQKKKEAAGKRGRKRSASNADGEPEPKKLKTSQDIHIAREKLNAQSKNETLQDEREETRWPAIHFGAIASGDTAIQSGDDSRQIAKDTGVIAFDTCGASIWEEVPCIIVKGVCDYGDCDPSKKWQDFAAATAASASKAILERYIRTEKPLYVPHSSGKEVNRTRDDQATRARVQSENRILRKENELLQQQLHFMRVLQAQLSLPRQITATDYIMIIDAHDRPLRFFLETIRTKKVFIEFMKDALGDLASKKLDREEWLLEDRDNDQIVDLKRPWLSAMKPGRTLFMSMIFRRRDVVSTQCPSCHAENSGSPAERTTCSCGLTYRRVEQIQDIEYMDKGSEVSQKLPAAASTARFNSQEIQTEAISPPKPNDSDDDISRYKRIQVVNTSFQLKRLETGGDRINHTPLSLQDLQDRDSLAVYLAKVYKVSEVDCLAALDELEPQLEAARAKIGHSSTLFKKKAASKPYRVSDTNPMYVWVIESHYTYCGCIVTERERKPTGDCNNVVVVDQGIQTWEGYCRRSVCPYLGR